VQKAIELRAVTPARGKLRFRMGITIGDIIERNNDLFGDGVNIAARLQALAPGGAICVSRGVYEQVGNRVLAVFTDLGLQKLKNMPDPVAAYLISDPGKVGGGAVAQPRAPDGPAAGAQKRSGSKVWIIVALALLGGSGIAFWRMQPGRSDGPAVNAASDSGSRVPPPKPSPKPEPIAPPDTSRLAVDCRDILERAQLGKLSAEDRITLQRSCK
jgi:hypothetical protein